MIVDSIREWPSDIPLPYIDFTGQPKGLTLASPPSAPKVFKRVLFARTYFHLQVQWRLTETQYESFRVFFAHELGEGSSAFDIYLRFPFTTVLTEWQVKFVGGFATSHQDGLWFVSATLFLLHPNDPLRNFEGPVDVDEEDEDDDVYWDDEGGSGPPPSCTGGDSAGIHESAYAWGLSSDQNPNLVIPQVNIDANKALLMNEVPGALGSTVITSWGGYFWSYHSTSETRKSALHKTDSGSVTPDDGIGEFNASFSGYWVLARHYCWDPTP